MSFVKKSEGGFVDNPDDPGGATNFGVTLRAWQAYTRKPVSVYDMQRLTWDEVVPFYAVSYFHATRSQDIPRGLDLMVMDMAVNCGVHASGLCLQKALGMTDDDLDGWIGRDTLSVLKERDPPTLIKILAVFQAGYYQSRSDYRRFERGFNNRLAARVALATSWTEPLHVVDTAPAGAPEPTPSSTPKASEVSQ